MIYVRAALGSIGGLALFLFAVRLVNSAFSSVPRLRAQKYFVGKMRPFFYGTGFAALTQSSSACTVTAVALVDNGLLPLSSAVFVVMGANLGSTVTGLLFAVRFSLLSPLFALAGVVLMYAAKQEKTRRLGSFLCGIGFLFIGADVMAQAVLPLTKNPSFLTLLSSAVDPFLCVLSGAAITALLQSSAATLNILQTLASSGAIPVRQAFFYVFGLNIGTCVTAYLAAIGASLSAKQVAAAHLLFNVLGALLFSPVVSAFPVDRLFAGLSPRVALALFHLVLNAATALCLFPFSRFLERLSFLLAEKTRRQAARPKT